MNTIWLRGEPTYSSDRQIALSKSGTSDTNRTKIWAYPGEVPVLDFSKYVTTNPPMDVPGQSSVTGSWMHSKDLKSPTVTVGASGSHSYSMLRTKRTSNNTFELLNIHHGFGPGLFIDTRATGGHLILNCDSHDNYDVTAVKATDKMPMASVSTTRPDRHHHDHQGLPGVVELGRWLRSINQEVPVLIENCWVMGSGFANYGTTNPADGNGNGFKMGGSKTDVRHTSRTLSPGSARPMGSMPTTPRVGRIGTTIRPSRTGLSTTCWRALGVPRRTGGVVLTGSLMHIMRNNIGFPNKNNDMIGTRLAIQHMGSEYHAQRQ